MCMRKLSVGFFFIECFRQLKIHNLVYARTRARTYLRARRELLIYYNCYCAISFGKTQITLANAIPLARKITNLITENWYCCFSSLQFSAKCAWFFNWKVSVDREHIFFSVLGCFLSAEKEAWIYRNRNIIHYLICLARKSVTIN